MLSSSMIISSSIITSGNNNNNDMLMIVVIILWAWCSGRLGSECRLGLDSGVQPLSTGVAIGYTQANI